MDRRGFIWGLWVGALGAATSLCLPCEAAGQRLKETQPQEDPASRLKASLDLVRKLGEGRPPYDLVPGRGGPPRPKWQGELFRMRFRDSS